MLGLFMVFPIFSLLANHYDYSTPFLMAIAMGIYGLTQALFQIPFGYLSDIYGRKKLIYVGLLLFLVGSLLASTTDNVYLLILARSIQGAGAVSAVLMAYLADYISPNNRTSANAFVGFQIGLAFIFSIIIAPVVINYFSISGLFVLMALFSLISFLILLTMPSTDRTTLYPFNKLSMKEILSNKLLGINASVFYLHFTLASTFVVLPSILVSDGITTMTSSWSFYLPVLLISFVLMIPFIILAHKSGYEKVILIFNLCIITLSQILFFIYSSNIISDNYFYIFFITLAFFVSFNALEATLPSLVSSSAPGEKRGLAMSFFTTSQFIGAFFGSLSAGFIISFAPLSYAFIMPPILFTLLLVFLLNKKNQSLVTH